MISSISYICLTHGFFVIMTFGDFLWNLSKIICDDLGKNFNSLVLICAIFFSTYRPSNKIIPIFSIFRCVSPWIFWWCDFRLIFLWNVYWATPNDWKKISNSLGIIPATFFSIWRLLGRNFHFSYVLWIFGDMTSN